MTCEWCFRTNTGRSYFLLLGAASTTHCVRYHNGSSFYYRQRFFKINIVDWLLTDITVLSGSSFNSRSLASHRKMNLPRLVLVPLLCKLHNWWWSRHELSIGSICSEEFTTPHAMRICFVMSPSVNVSAPLSCSQSVISAIEFEPLFSWFWTI